MTLLDQRRLTDLAGTEDNTYLAAGDDLLERCFG